MSYPPTPEASWPMKPERRSWKEEKWQPALAEVMESPNYEFILAHAPKENAFYYEVLIKFIAYLEAARSLAGLRPYRPLPYRGDLETALILEAVKADPEIGALFCEFITPRVPTGDVPQLQKTDDFGLLYTSINELYHKFWIQAPSQFRDPKLERLSMKSDIDLA